MPELDDMSDRCLVVAASEVHWQSVLRPAIRTASLPDGRPLEPERIDPRRVADLSADRTLDLLECGAVTVVDLDGVPAPAFALLSWHARARPSSVLLFRPGLVSLPFELHEFPVRTYDAVPEEEAARSRLLVARLAAVGSHARGRAGAAESALSTRRGNRDHRRRRLRNGVTDALRRAGRALLAGDPSLALEALGEALVAEPDAPDLLLRAALLHRDAGRWPAAAAALARAVAVDPDGGPAWRELGIVRDRGGEPGSEAALRRAIDLDGDYDALVSLSFLASRRGATAEALALLERAIEASEGQLNLVVPALVLRSARDGRVRLSEREGERVAEVLAIRSAQALSTPPEDAPWSHFDAAQAALLLCDPAAAASLVDAAREHVHAPWETETFARSIDALERAGVDVQSLRSALGIQATRTQAAPAAPRAPGRPFRAAVRARDWYRKNVPCATACPVGTDSGAYVTLAARGRFAEAFRVARGPNPFASVCGRICAAPCEDACRRGKVDAPVAIRAIKRFLTSRHGVESGDSRIADVMDGSPALCMEGEAYTSHLRKLGAGALSGRRVDVVGGGPAGLACAHDLALLGHRVTLYEASGSLGGMMRHGIPEYRLPRDVLDAEIGTILDLGVEVRLNEGLDARRTLGSLLDAQAEGGTSADAVFLASGAGRGRDMEVEGGGLDGVVRAIDFLLNVNQGFRMDLGPRVVVVGGGSVAIDVARTARLGRPPDVRPRAEAREATHAMAPALRGEELRTAVEGRAREVHVVARQPMGLWPAQKSVHGKEEVEEARREGVSFHPQRGIRRVLGTEGGRVTGVELAEVVQWTDEKGRSDLAFGAHRAEEIPCDAVLLAIGQEPDLDYLEGTASLRRTANGLVEVDRETLSTSLPGVFAGGDAAFGPRTLIEAVAEGKRAARSIHAHLSGGKRLRLVPSFEPVHPRSVPVVDDYDRLPRVDPACVAVERRTGIAEVEGPYEEAEAVRQASRCLSCHVQTMYDGTRCVACGRCADACPYRCLSLVPPGDVDASGLDASAFAEAGGDSGAVLMLKDEASCVRCGLCAQRCPTGAMTMERFDVRATAVEAIGVGA